MSERTPDPSPRTDAEPMAFTADEFLRGAVAAWLWFNLLFDPTLAVVSVMSQSPQWGPWWSGAAMMLLYGAPIAFVVSGLVTLLSCGAAWIVGRMLSRRRSLVLHSACYALLGAAIGTLVVVGYTVAIGASVGEMNPIAVIAIGSSAAAVPLGWGWTVRRSVRIEARRERRPSADVDAEYEDSL